MRVLALETSTGRGSVALMDDTGEIFESVLSESQRTAQSLIPAIDEALKRRDWLPTSIQLVALTNGPGSFTGLRIAVTTAKTLAYFTHADLVALSTLDVLAEQLPEQVGEACPIMDAQRRQLFVAHCIRRPDGRWETVVPCHIVDRSELLSSLPAKTLVTGPGLTRLDDTICPAERRAEPSLWYPRAATVVRLAAQLHREGRRDDPLGLKPEYHRPSYAEEPR